MRLVFLGGANEVGASCLWCDLGGAKLLIDAGIRVGDPTDPLPDLAQLQALGGIDAIVITHAHLDHIGALPLVSQAYPAAPIYCHPATFGVLRVMLGDALRVMGSRLEDSGEIPLYSEAAATAALERVRPAPWAIPVVTSGYTLELFPAGHVLGASGVILTGEGGMLLVSGDVSGPGQRTVEGCRLPALSRRPDALVLESTYGHGLHPSRGAEEERLARAVADVITGGGKALIPAFALGRGQEVAFALRAAQESRIVPRFPILIDGLVGTVCSLYSGFAEHGSRELRRRARDGDPVFDRSGWVTRVKPTQRDRVLAGPPAAIIASSGMLTGGPSAYYAAQLAGDPRHAVFLTGYQDEESPGRRLLELADGVRQTISLGEQELAVQAKVARFSLSAHADGNWLAQFAEASGATTVILVHGEQAARAALSELISGRTVLTPSNGDTLDIAGAPPKVSPRAPEAPAASPPAEGSATPDVAPVTGAAEPDALPPADIDLLSSRLASGETQRHYTLRELALTLWGRTSPALQQHLTAALDAAPAFKRDPQRRYLYRYRPDLTGDDGGALAPGEAPGGRLEQNAAIAALDQEFTEGPAPYRKGIHPAEGRIVLYFHFPAVAQVRHAELLQRLSARLGWTLEVHQSVHHGELAAAARTALGPAVGLAREPAIHLEARVVRVRLSPDSPAPDPDAFQSFRALTGFTLELDGPARPAGGEVAAAKSPAGWEQNRLFAEIDRVFGALPHRPYRKSLKTDHVGKYIELAFITAEVGARYAEAITGLSTLSGWRFEVAREPNQQQVIDVLRRLTQGRWPLAANPSVRIAERVVEAKLGARVEAEDREALLVAFTAATGYQLVLR